MARCYPQAGPPRQPSAVRAPASSPGLACPLLALSRSCQITSAACWRRPFISLRAARPGGRRPQARIMGRATHAGDLAHGGSCRTGAGAGWTAAGHRRSPVIARRLTRCGVSSSRLKRAAPSPGRPPTPQAIAPAAPPPRRASSSPFPGGGCGYGCGSGGSGIRSAARTFRPGRFSPATCPRWPVPRP
jgi:hypothetical protein